jgi:hypothetical protein
VGSRPLTDGEVDLVHNMFGYDFNTSGNLIKFGENPSPNTGYTPDGVASMGKNVYLGDYSKANKDYIGFFLHEMTHAYVYQLTGKSQLNLGSIFAQADTDYSDRIVSKTPFSKWNVEEQANYVQDMYLRSQGIYRKGSGGIFSEGKFKYKLTDKQFNSVDTKGLIIRRLEVQCFPANTPVQISQTENKPISEIRVGDIVMSFDPTADGGRGALVPKRVKRLFRNTTTEWIKLTWLENGEAKKLVATPGHHMLDKTGAFTRLDRLVQNGKAEIVLASGEVVEAQAEHITYSAETAHLFEQAGSSSQIAINGADGLMN